MRRKHIRLMTGVLQYCTVYKGPIIVGSGYIINWQGAISWPQLTSLAGDELPEDIYALMPDETKPKDQLVIVNWSIH
jgi:hypothetical protein